MWGRAYPGAASRDNSADEFEDHAPRMLVRAAATLPRIGAGVSGSIATTIVQPRNALSVN
jgi:hypothetical protein